jgi:putative transcriptional regulator
VNNRLRVLRAEHNLSQAALAELLGVSRQTVNAIETGKYDPSLPLAFKIARVFGEPIENIFQPDQDSMKGLAHIAAAEKEFPPS